MRQVMAEMAESIQRSIREAGIFIPAILSKQGAHVSLMHDRQTIHMVSDKPQRIPKVNLQSPVASVIFTARKIATAAFARSPFNKEEAMWIHDLVENFAASAKCF